MAKRKSRGMLGLLGDIKYDAIAAIYGYMKRYDITAIASDLHGDIYELRVATTSSGDRTIEVRIKGTEVWTDLMMFSVEAIVNMLANIEAGLGIEDE